MRRRLGYASFALAALVLLVGSAVGARQPDLGSAAGTPTWIVLNKGCLAPGVVGFAVTFARQQPLFSLIG
ncbi:MAG: hypothetical protein ABEJ05_08465 [Haloglomus sp.]